MHKIVLVGLSADPTVRWLAAQALKGRHGPLVEVVPLEELVTSGHVELPAGEDSEPVLHAGTRRVDFRGVLGCYARLIDPPAGGAAPGELRRRRSRFNALLVALQRSRRRVVNPPLCDGGNSSKPLQTVLLAREYGFRVPRTLATTDPGAALAFAEALDWQVIYKSTSGQTSVVSRLTPRRRADLERVRACPLLLQELIAGPDVRLHLVDGQPFAERIEFAGGEDARHGPRESRRFEPARVPEGVLARCRAFARDAHLPLVGFDFKFAEATGEYVVLEANPTPAFEGYDFRCGGRIAAALLDLLAVAPPG
jgi:hypothetical protein